jgi:hypothetical protein
MVNKFKTLGLLTLVLIGVFAFTNGTKFSEGVAEFEISYQNLPEEMKQAEAMLPKKLTMYFKGQNTRSEMPSSMGNTITISNETKKEYYVLMDMMGSKTAIKQTTADIKKLQDEQQVKDLKVVTSNDTKTIAGYTCKKAIITFTTNGQKEQIDCYYTEELPAITARKDISPGFDQIKGFMMEYAMNTNGIKMKITATKVRAEKVDDKLFTLPEGYTITTIDELKQQFKD